MDDARDPGSMGTLPRSPPRRRCPSALAETADDPDPFTGAATPRQSFPGDWDPGKGAANARKVAGLAEGDATKPSPSVSGGEKDGKNRSETVSLSACSRRKLTQHEDYFLRDRLVFTKATTLSFCLNSS